MDRDTAQSLLTDYLFDELAPVERDAVEAQLLADASLREQLRDLRLTTRLLREGESVAVLESRHAIPAGLSADRRASLLAAAGVTRSPSAESADASKSPDSGSRLRFPPLTLSLAAAALLLSLLTLGLIFSPLLSPGEPTPLEPQIAETVTPGPVVAPLPTAPSVPAPDPVALPTVAIDPVVIAAAPPIAASPDDAAATDPAAIVDVSAFTASTTRDFPIYWPGARLATAPSPDPTLVDAEMERRTTFDLAWPTSRQTVMPFGMVNPVQPPASFDIDPTPSQSDSSAADPGPAAPGPRAVHPGPGRPVTDNERKMIEIIEDMFGR